MQQRRSIIITAWFVAIAAAALFDKPVAVWVHSSPLPQWIGEHKHVAAIIKLPGEFYFTATVAIIVALVHPLHWRAGAFMLLATAISGVNATIKWIVGRTRPYKLAMYDGGALGTATPQPFVFSPFRNGFGGMMESKNLCFPSGHAALAFATAAAVAMLWPRSRWRWLAFVWPVIVAAERVAENAHWLSDVVAAAALGVGGVHVLHWIITKVIAPGENSAQPILHD